MRLEQATKKEKLFAYIFGEVRLLLGGRNAAKRALPSIPEGTEVDLDAFITARRRMAVWTVFWLLILPGALPALAVVRIALSQPLGTTVLAVAFSVLAYFFLLVLCAKAQERMVPHFSGWLTAKPPDKKD